MYCNSVKQKTINILIHGDYNSALYSILQNIKNSPVINKIYIMNQQKNFIYKDLCINAGNSGKTTLKELKEFIKKENINLAMIFGESYLLNGFTDFYYEKIKIPVFGATKNWFKIEASKITGKEFMTSHHIKTPDFFPVFTLKDLKEAINKLEFPIIIKNNFTQDGYESYICKNEKECKSITKKFLEKYSFCVAEELKEGEEISQLYIWDKQTLIPLIPVRNFKILNINSNKINRGSLGCYTPVMLSKKKKEMIEEYNTQLKKIFTNIKPDFCGIFTANLLFSENCLYTLEFNMQTITSELETLLEHLDYDVGELFYKIAISDAQNSIIKYKKGITGSISLIYKDYHKQINRIRKEKLDNILPKKGQNVKIHPNFSMKEKINNNIKFIESRPVYNVLKTADINPFNEIYDFLDQIENNNFYYTKAIGDEYDKQFFENINEIIYP